MGSGNSTSTLESREVSVYLCYADVASLGQEHAKPRSPSMLTEYAPYLDAEMLAGYRHEHALREMTARQRDIAIRLRVRGGTEHGSMRALQCWAPEEYGELTADDKFKLAEYVYDCVATLRLAGRQQLLCARDPVGESVFGGGGTKPALYATLVLGYSLTPDERLGEPVILRDRPWTLNPATVELLVGKVHGRIACLDRPLPGEMCVRVCEVEWRVDQRICVLRLLCGKDSSAKCGEAKLQQWVKAVLLGVVCPFVMSPEQGLVTLRFHELS